MDLTVDYAPDLPAMWAYAGVSVVFLFASIALTIRRRKRGRSPGTAVYVLLGAAALAACLAYWAYFPACPRNFWC